MHSQAVAKQVRVLAVANLVLSLPLGLVALASLVGTLISPSEGFVVSVAWIANVCLILASSALVAFMAAAAIRRPAAARFGGAVIGFGLLFATSFAELLFAMRHAAEGYDPQISAILALVFFVATAANVWVHRALCRSAANS